MGEHLSTRGGGGGLLVLSLLELVPVLVAPLPNSLWLGAQTAAGYTSAEIGKKGRKKLQ